MRHLKKGRKFGRLAGQRKSLLRNLAFQLITKERITTTEAKAKELAPLVEKMITRAKSQDLPAQRLLVSRVPSEAVAKLINIIGPRMKSRPGGYTRIIKLPTRKSDASRMAIIEFVK